MEHYHESDGLFHFPITFSNGCFIPKVGDKLIAVKRFNYNTVEVNIGDEYFLTDLAGTAAGYGGQLIVENDNYTIRADNYDFDYDIIFNNN